MLFGGVVVFVDVIVHDVVVFVKSIKCDTSFITTMSVLSSNLKSKHANLFIQRLWRLCRLNAMLCICFLLET